jgi:hypothetical protein
MLLEEYQQWLAAKDQSYEKSGISLTFVALFRVQNGKHLNLTFLERVVKPGSLALQL